jgi:hypothetical protein
VNNTVSRRIINDLQSIKNYTVIAYSQTTQRLYNDKDIQGIVTIRDSLGSDGTQFYKVYITYDKSKDQNKIVYDKLSSQLSRTEKMLQEERLQSAGISPDFLKLIEVRERRYIQRHRKKWEWSWVIITLFSHNDVICRCFNRSCGFGGRRKRKKNPGDLACFFSWSFRDCLR